MWGKDHRVIRWHVHWLTKGSGYINVNITICIFPGIAQFHGSMWRCINQNGRITYPLLIKDVSCYILYEVTKIECLAITIIRCCNDRGSVNTYAHTPGGNILTNNCHGSSNRFPVCLDRCRIGCGLHLNISSHQRKISINDLGNKIQSSVRTIEISTKDVPISWHKCIININT